MVCVSCGFGVHDSVSLLCGFLCRFLIGFIFLGFEIGLLVMNLYISVVFFLSCSLAIFNKFLVCGVLWASNFSMM